MARIENDIMGIEGRVGGLTTYIRNGKKYVRVSTSHQPRRLSRKQLLVRERQSHNNALLLPDMVLSDGPLPPVSYQLGEVDGQPALLTDLTPKDVRNLSAPDDAVNGKGTSLLLYILKQRVIPQHVDTDLFQLSIKVEALTAEAFTTVPSTLLSPYKNAQGTLALIGDRFADPMLGFGIVRIKDGHASRQHVITRCTYYEQYTTEEALQAAAKSYKGLTGDI